MIWTTVKKEPDDMEVALTTNAVKMSCVLDVSLSRCGPFSSIILGSIYEKIHALCAKLDKNKFGKKDLEELNSNLHYVFNNYQSINSLHVDGDTFSLKICSYDESDIQVTLYVDSTSAMYKLIAEAFNSSGEVENEDWESIVQV